MHSNSTLRRAFVASMAVVALATFGLVGTVAAMNPAGQPPFMSNCATIMPVFQPATPPSPSPDPCGTPLPTASPTPTASPSPTPTASPTASPTVSPTGVDQTIAVNDHTTVPGEQVVVSGEGAGSGTTVHLWLHSTPVSLGTTVALQDGTYSQLVTIPAGTAAGAHLIEAIGTDPSDEAFSITTAITVTIAAAPATSTALDPNPSDGSGASVGFLVFLVLAGLAGVSLALVRDRRRGR